MAYSENLDESVPAGGESIKLGDNRIRALTKAVKERLASFFQDPNADPLVPKNDAVTTAMIQSGAVTGAKLSPALPGADRFLRVDAVGDLSWSNLPIVKDTPHTLGRIPRITAVGLGDSSIADDGATYTAATQPRAIAYLPGNQVVAGSSSLLINGVQHAAGAGISFSSTTSISATVPGIYLVTCNVYGETGVAGINHLAFELFELNSGFVIGKFRSMKDAVSGVGAFGGGIAGLFHLASGAASFIVIVETGASLNLTEGQLAVAKIF